MRQSGKEELARQYSSSALDSVTTHSSLTLGPVSVINTQESGGRCVVGGSNQSVPFKSCVGNKYEEVIAKSKKEKVNLTD